MSSNGVHCIVIDFIYNLATEVKCEPLFVTPMPQIPEPETQKPKNLSSKKISGRQREEGHEVVHHVQ